MKVVLAIAATIVLLMPTASVLADEQAEEQALRLFEIMNMEQIMSESITQMLDIQTQQNPDLANYRPVMLEFFAKYMSFESIKPEMAALYADAFTADELKDLIAFHQTPTGQKSIDIMPRLMREGANIGAVRVQENIGELQRMMAEAAEESEAQ